MKDKIIVLFIVKLFFISSFLYADNVPKNEVEELIALNQKHISIYDKTIECFKSSRIRADAIICAESMDHGLSKGFEKYYFIQPLILSKYWDFKINEKIIDFLKLELRYFVKAESCLPNVVNYKELASCKSPLAFPIKWRNVFRKYTQVAESEGEIIYKNSAKIENNTIVINHLKVISESDSAIELEVKFTYLKSKKLGVFSGDILPDFEDISFEPFNPINSFFLRHGVNIAKTKIKLLEKGVLNSFESKNLTIYLGFSLDSSVTTTFKKTIPFNKIWKKIKHNKAFKTRTYLSLASCFKGCSFV